MNDHRPDPDQLLAKVQHADARQRRGRLKIFFGMAPGVGKTYAMLEAARKLGREGGDVVVGYVEPHARTETQALVLGLDVLPRITVEYRGTKLLEFDVEAALARKPQVCLVDELAHTNAPGMTHAKRWQDVEQLLAAEIDVYTTLNVQHLESLNDVLAQITQVRVRETVPDHVFDNADEIELVDIAPLDLIDRLREGKVYVPEQAARAMDQFFQEGHLIALRELALRRTADRVDAQMVNYRQGHAIESTWHASDRLLVCVSASPMSARLIRSTRRMAAGLRAPWLALHVETPHDYHLSDESQQRLAENLHLAQQLGAEVVHLTGASITDEVISYARSRNVTKIIVGKPQQSRWRDLIRGSYVYELTRKCGDIDIYVISGDQEGKVAQVAETRPRSPMGWKYLNAAMVVAGCTVVAYLLEWWLAPTNLAMIFLLGVVIVSLRWGRGPSILASLLGVAAFDFGFVPPRLTFAVADTQYLLTFIVMLLVGLITSSLTARISFQVNAARSRERRASALYSLGREIISLKDRSAIVTATAQHAAAALDARVLISLPDAEHKLRVESVPDTAIALSDTDQGVLQWVFEHGEQAGWGTRTLPAATMTFFPMRGEGKALGVIGMRCDQDDVVLNQEKARLLEAFASMAAIALEKLDLASAAQKSTVRLETERLRNSLLSAVSHDLRTPLAVIAGASSTLVVTHESLESASKLELAKSIFCQSERLNRLVTNLLDLTRLEGGGLVLHQELLPLEEVVGALLHQLPESLKSHPIKVDLPADLPMIPVDELLIQQVLVNLIENATHFAPPGSAIELSAVASADSVTIRVADHGPGLGPGDEERVFEKFYRATDGEWRSGAGLGLAICRGIVELHGGEIWAENRASGGARFQFSLPLRKSLPVALPPEEALPATPEPADPRATQD